jgi:sporulation protein YlmC with PRC-barrel domain
MDRIERNDRNGRDAAGIGPYAQERESLVPMRTLKSWTVSSGEPDIRGWEVRTVSGRQLGSVSDLLIDQSKGEVVLLDVDLPGSDHHTFVPIRIVEIDRAKRVVLMDSADLPESDLTRSERDVTTSVLGEGGTVRYPVDREVREARPELADTTPPPPRREVVERPDRPVAEDPIMRDRRRAERRRIDRMSSDL